jgi:hypothetical protein
MDFPAGRHAVDPQENGILVEIFLTDPMPEGRERVAAPYRRIVRFAGHPKKLTDSTPVKLPLSWL